MSFKIAVLAVALLACQGNAQILGGFMRPFISGYANGISEMAKPFIQLGQSVVSPATEYFGSMKPGMSQYFSYPSKPFAAAQSAVQEAQAAAQLAAQQAQLVAQSAIEQAEAAAKQAQAAVYEGYQTVSSAIPGVPGTSTIQVIRPRPFGPQSAIQEAQALAQAAAKQAQEAAKQAQAAVYEGYQTVSSAVPGVPGANTVQVIRPSPIGPQSAIQEAQAAAKQAQAAAQYAAQQAQLAAKTAVEQAEGVAKQVQAHAQGKIQTVSSLVPEFPETNAVQVSRPRPTGSQTSQVGQAIRPRPYPLPMPTPSAESESEAKESVETHVPASLLPEISGDFSVEGQAGTNVPMTLEARGELEMPNLLPAVQGQQ